MFDWAKGNEEDYYYSLLNHAIQNIQYALTGDDTGYKKATKELVYYHTPGEWRPDKKNELYKADDLFENQCILLEKHGNSDAENLSLFKFYKRLDYLRKNARSNNRI